MDKEYTRTWHILRQDYPMEWATWLGQPNLFDGGQYVNRTKEEHNISRIYFK